MKILLILAAFFSALTASNPNFGLGINSLGEQSEQAQNEKRFSKREEAARQAIENADYDAAFKILSPLCEEGNDDGCRALGFENYEKNIEIYEKFESIAEGCKFGNDSDCKLLKARIAEF